MRKEILNNNHIQISENQLLNGVEIIFFNKMTEDDLKEKKTVSDGQRGSNSGTQKKEVKNTLER